MPNLKTQPKYLRSSRSTGSIERIDTRGGYRSAGVIRGVSVITAGEALGHDLWIDDEMLHQVADAINKKNKGLKSRFTHPNMSGDGLGKFVGRVMDAEVRGDQVIADQHFSEAGHSTPDGDLAGWLMDMAKEDPDAYGLSIVFDIDEDAIEEFTEEYTENGEWESPDSSNTKNLLHARLAEIRAVDSVDEPAANPEGLFHRNKSVVEEADRIAHFALGLTGVKPETSQLGFDADRVRGFVQRFLETNNLEISTVNETEHIEPENETEVQDENAVAVAAEEESETQEEVQEVETEESVESETVMASSDRGEAARFLAEFGAKGAVWFAEGRDFNDCRSLETSELRREVEELKVKLSASIPSGEHEPIAFESDEVKRKSGFASKIQIK